VSYLGFTVGYLTTKVKTKSIDGREIYQLKVTGNSSGLAYWFYSVRDEFVSYVDATDYFSLGYDYEKNHGGEREFETVRYDHKKGLYFKNGKETGNIPPYSHDVLSALYFLRGQEMEVGNRYQFPVHVGDEAYRLELLVEGKDEVATSSRGWVEAFRIKPSLQDPQKEKEFKEKLKGEENKVRIWISDDSAKIPLQISVPAKVGTFWGYLSSYKPGKTK